MATTKRQPKTKKSAKRRGSAEFSKAAKPKIQPVPKSPARAKAAGVQPSLPSVGDGREPKLEALDVELVAAREQEAAEKTQRKCIELRMVETLQKLGREYYKTASGFVIRAEPKVKFTRKKAPKSKRERKVA